MVNNADKTKRIAKNTVLLYVQMFVTMAVSLYTSRVILDALGVVDFGIYNLVGGFVSMFGIVKAGLVSATQRFISFELGVGNYKELRRTFSTCVFIYLFLAVLATLLAETFGPWFIESKLRIPHNRVYAAYWVFHLSLISLVGNLLSYPYNALIIAHERMKAFAYVSVIESFLKLGISLLIYIAFFDKLIEYTLLLCLVQLLVPTFYFFYCKKNFKESKLLYKFDKAKLKEIYAFTGWSMFGGLANMSITQGLNFLLGMYFSPVVNAARGIAVQVQAAISQFASNFQLAIDPQIIKSYAAEEKLYLSKLIFASSRFSFFLLYIISLPIVLEADIILKLWLHEVPAYTTVFFRLVILVTIMDAVTNPAVKAIQATGKIKQYQLSVNTLIIATLPISYLALHFGFPPYSVFIVLVIMNFIAFMVRFYMIDKLVKIKVSDIFRRIISPIIKVVILSCALPIIVHVLLPDTILRLLLVLVLSTIIILLVSYAFGMDANEKSICKSRLKILKTKYYDNKKNN